MCASGSRWTLFVRLVANSGLLLLLTGVVTPVVTDVSSTFVTNEQANSAVLSSVSNVLKTRHDTVKNSIGNIR